MLDVRRFDAASDLLARVVAAEPESSRAWCLMSRAHLGAERYPDAVSTANRAVSLDPADEWPHRLASNALVHLGRHADALRAAYEAARLAPGYWQTHVCVTLAALILIWIPAVTHVDRLPFVIALAAVAAATVAWFAWTVVRLPREARLMVRRTLRAPRVAAALTLAAGGVGAAFGLVAFTPAADLAQILPVAVVITVVARLAAFAALRGAARQR